RLGRARTSRAPPRSSCSPRPWTRAGAPARCTRRAPGGSRPDAALEVLLDFGFELAARHRADELADHATLLEDEEGGDRGDAVLLGDDLVVIDVHLGDLEAALVLVSERVHGRRDLLART